MPYRHCRRDRRMGDRAGERQGPTRPLESGKLWPMCSVDPSREAAGYQITDTGFIKESVEKRYDLERIHSAHPRQTRACTEPYGGGDRKRSVGKLDLKWSTCWPLVGVGTYLFHLYRRLCCVIVCINYPLSFSYPPSPSDRFILSS